MGRGYVNCRLDRNRIAIDRNGLDMRDRRHGFSICATGSDDGKSSIHGKPDVSMLICGHRPIAPYPFGSMQAIRKTVFANIFIAYNAAQKSLPG